MLKLGDRIVHENMPEWGIGQVCEVLISGHVMIFFVDGGQKKFNPTFPALRLVTGREAAHPLLDAINPQKGVHAKFLSPEKARARFMATYPGGFSDVDYLRKTRAPRASSMERVHELLSRAELERLVEAENWAEIATRARKVINATPLVMKKEKTVFSAALGSEAAQAAFAKNLWNLLYGEGDAEVRFTAFALCMSELSACTWTIVTFFLCFAGNERGMFVKPAIIQNAEKTFAFDLKYQPEVNWATYQAVMGLADYIEHEISDMSPKDMLDVQSYLWCIAQA